MQHIQTRNFSISAFVASHNGRQHITEGIVCYLKFVLLMVDRAIPLNYLLKKRDQLTL